MKKRIIIPMLFVLCLLLAGCSHTHTWQAASCSSPKICPECGETEGEALGHKWIDATCMDAQVCEVCLNTLGSPLGHNWIEATCTNAQFCERCNATEGDPLEHNFSEATCTAAMKCVDCGLAEGQPIPHTWQAATCAVPETCISCGATQGEALGHTFDTWELVENATCAVPGKESSICTVCGEPGERKTELAEHTEGKLTVDVAATPTTEGTKVKKCTECDAVLHEEKYNLSDSEKKKYYDTEYATISYDKLSRNPQDYKGKKVKFSGKVLQVCSEATSSLYYSTYRVATSGSSKNVVYICVDNYGSGSRILEDDRVTFYGTFDGLYTYETVLGASVTIPKIIVDYII